MSRVLYVLMMEEDSCNDWPILDRIVGVFVSRDAAKARAEALIAEARVNGSQEYGGYSDLVWRDDDGPNPSAHLYHVDSDSTFASVDAVELERRGIGRVRDHRDEVREEIAARCAEWDRTVPRD